MKHLLLVAGLLLAAPVAHAQKGKAEKVKDDTTPPTLPIDPDTHLVSYTGVVEVTGVSQAQLYSRAYEWIAKNYKSANDVIQMQDKESGKLIAKGLLPVSLKGRAAGNVEHTLSVYVKDGRYKYEFTSLRHQYMATGQHGGDYSMGPFENAEPTLRIAFVNGQIKKSWDQIRRNTENDITAMTASLEAAMTGKTKDKSDF
jgi:hypothetical protein